VSPLPQGISQEMLALVLCNSFFIFKVGFKSIILWKISDIWFALDSGGFVLNIIMTKIFYKGLGMACFQIEF